MTQRSDYILRIIEQLGAALQRIRQLLMGGVTSAEEGLRQLAFAEEELFGDRLPVLAQLDASTAVALIADERQVTTWIELIRLRAEASRLLGKSDFAAEHDLRALQLERARDALAVASAPAI